MRILFTQMRAATTAKGEWEKREKTKLRGKYDYQSGHIIRMKLLTHEKSRAQTGVVHALSEKSDQ